MSEAALEALLRRDRVVIGAALTALVVASWLYLLHLASTMSDMAMPKMPTMPGMAMAMPTLHAWSWVEVGALVVMWGVMMIAMMTPAAAPLILMFSTIHRCRTAEGRPAVPTVIFVLGYLVVWTIYSVVAALAQAGLHAAALLSPAMASTSPLLAGGLLVTAGVFQWTPLKRTCLAACRSPLSFFMTGWPISARADVWLRRAVRMAGEVTDRALRIPYVKGTVRLPAILFTVSAVPSGGKPPGTQRGGPAGVAGTDLPYHSAAGVTGNYSEDGDKDRARCRVRDAIRAGILIRPTRCDRGGRPEEQSPGSGRHPQGLAFAACRRVMADHF